MGKNKDRNPVQNFFANELAAIERDRRSGRRSPVTDKIMEATGVSSIMRTLAGQGSKADKAVSAMSMIPGVGMARAAGKAALGAKTTKAVTAQNQAARSYITKDAGRIEAGKKAAETRAAREAARVENAYNTGQRTGAVKGAAAVAVPVAGVVAADEIRERQERNRPNVVAPSRPNNTANGKTWDSVEKAIQRTNRPPRSNRGK